MLSILKILAGSKANWTNFAMYYVLLINYQYVEYNKVHADSKFAKIHNKASLYRLRVCDFPCTLKPNFLSQSRNKFITIRLISISRVWMPSKLLGCRPIYQRNEISLK